MEAMNIMEFSNFHYVHGFQFFICQMPSQTVATENLQKPMTTNKTVMCSCYYLKKQMWIMAS